MEIHKDRVLKVRIHDDSGVWMDVTVSESSHFGRASIGYRGCLDSRSSSAPWIEREYRVESFEAGVERARLWLKRHRLMHHPELRLTRQVWVEAVGNNGERLTKLVEAWGVGLEVFIWFT